VHPSVPVTTIPEFIAYAKANPGRINYGSAGRGTPQNIACELFKIMAGVNLVHVPYRGGAPATFGTILLDATEKWARVIRVAGIKAE
jgi:tripartite-type tricarboxylate transporter receptor subunit TctC